VGAAQPDRAILALAASLEPVAEEGVLVDLEVVGGQGGAGRIANGRTAALEPTKVGVQQADGAGRVISRDHRSIQDQHGSGEQVGVQRRQVGVLEPAPGQDKARQFRVAGDETFVQ
jgi:hypothetical protein